MKINKNNELASHLFAVLFSILLFSILAFLAQTIFPSYGFYMNYTLDLNVMTLFWLPKVVLEGIYLIYSFHFIGSVDGILDFFWWSSLVAIPLILASVYAVATLLKIHKKDSFAKCVAIAFFFLSLIAIILMYLNEYQVQTSSGVDVDFNILIPEFIQSVLFVAFATFILFLWQRLIFNFDRRKFINSIKLAGLFSLGLALIEIIFSFISVAYYGAQYNLGDHYLDLIIGIIINSVLWSVVFFNALDRKIDAWSYIFAFLYITPEIFYFVGRAGDYLDPIHTASAVFEKILELALLYILINREHKKKIKTKK